MSAALYSRRRRPGRRSNPEPPSPRRSLFHGQDLDVALSAVGAGADVVALTLEEQIDRPVPDAEVLDPDLWQKRWQPGIVEADLRGRAANRQPHAGLEEHEDGRRGPGLRGTGDRIQR